MSEEQLKAFMEAIKADAGLQEKLRVAADVDAVVAIAKDAGFLICAAEPHHPKAELSDKELEGVAGGFCGMSDPLPIADNISQYVVGAPICFFFA